MELRVATANDIDEIYRLSQQIGQQHYRQAPQAFAAPSMEEKAFWLSALEDEERLFLVGELQGQVIAFLTATVSRNENIPFLVSLPICKVGTIVVGENYQSKGVGQQLMLACERWAKQQGAEQIRLEVMSFNQNAQGFYSKLGFDCLSQSMWKPLLP